MTTETRELLGAGQDGHCVGHEGSNETDDSA